jgi:CheY-like chemotaxis protein
MPKWIVVEDELDLHDTLMAMFEVWGIDGISFDDGQDILDWLDRVDNGEISGELPQLALIDLRLPSAFGVDVAMRIRQSPVLSDIAIILMTAYSLSPEQETQFINDVQADAFLNKPLPEMKQLQKLLNGLVAKRYA